MPSALAAVVAVAVVAFGLSTVVDSSPSTDVELARSATPVAAEVPVEPAPTTAPVVEEPVVESIESIEEPVAPAPAPAVVEPVVDEPGPVAAVTTAGAPDAGLVMAHWVSRHRFGDYSMYRRGPAYPLASTSDADYVRWAVDGAVRAGLDGFVVDWAPFIEGEADVAFAEAAGRDDFVVAPILNVRFTNEEATSQVAPDAELVGERLLHLWERYGQHPGAHRLDDGRLVVWLYQAVMIDTATWERVVADLEASGARLALMGGNVRPDGLGPFHGAFVSNSLQFDDVASTYRAAATHVEAAGPIDGRDRVWAATVTPGMWDKPGKWRIRLHDRADGALYAQQWEAARSSGADWVFVVSWNEYNEDTGIEPTLEWGDTYVEATAAEVARFRAGITAAP